MLDLAPELARLPIAREQLPSVVDRYSDLAHQLNTEPSSPGEARASAHIVGAELWRRACSDTHATNLDDRALYWGRLAIAELLSRWDQPEVLQTFERISRNFDSAAAEEGEILLTGFDPFRLNDQITQCNPSGSFALALHGESLGGLRVRSMIFPVRYADFDAGCVEQALTPSLVSPRTRLIVTASMGRDGFDLERFPAKCRGAKQPDNQNVDITQRVHRFEPPLDGPDFLEFSLPAQTMLEKMRHVSGVRITDNRKIETVEDGVCEIQSLAEIHDKQAAAGSGGNFLSNEISYRALRLQAALGGKVPVGHVHVPRVAGYDTAAIALNFDVFKALLSTLADLVTS